MTWHWNSVPADAGIRDQIAASMNACVGTYNAYSNYDYDIGVVYGSGTPTADAGYLGQIRFGGSRGYHTAMHESSHWLGTGTVGDWDIHFRRGKWNGTYAYNLKTAYDGPGERQSGDGAHYWPYGANSGAEGVQGDIMVHLIGAFRRDMNLWGGDQSIGVPESTYRLRNRQFVKVLDSMGDNSEGRLVKQNENGNNSGQTWNVSKVDGTPYFTLKNATTGKYLDSLGGTAEGSPVGMTSLTGGVATDSQQWQILPTDSFFFKIVNKANGLVLDNLGSSEDGTVVAQGASGTSRNQQWTFLHPLIQKKAQPGVISQGRPVAASSVESGNYDWKGNNGVAGDRWAASSGSFPQWWRVDTGSVQSITKVEIDWFNSGTPTFQYQIQVSDDGQNWMVAADRTNNAVWGTTVDRVAATGRYVRVYVTDASAGYASFSECRVYNEAEPMKLVSEFRPTTASSEQPGNLAVNATDLNSIHTRWCSASSGYPAWWQVDLGSHQQVNKAVIQWFDDGGRSYKYRLEGSEDGVNYTTLIDRTGNTQSQTTTDEFSGVARYVRVMVTGGSGTWPSLYDVQIYSATSELNAYAPQNVIATPTGNQVALSWPAVDGATSYTVKRSTSPGGPYVTIGTPASPSYNDSGVVAGVSYYYVVIATNSLGTSGNSPEASALVNADLQVNLPFDEASGGVAADISGYNRDGSLFTWPVWGVGNTGSAIDLDGLDDYVALPQGVVSQLNDFTIATWVNPEVLSSWARVFDFGTGTNNYMFLTSSTGGSVRFAIRTPSVGEQRLTGTTPLPTGVWSHIAVTLSGTNATLYVNGVAVATNTAMTLKPSSLGSTTQNWIGRSQFADPYFNGNVDDFRIYNRALTGNEIDKLRGAVSPSAPSSLAIQQGDGQASISWAAAVGAISYQVKRSSTPGGPYTVIATVNSPGYVDSGLSNDTSYYYVVSSLNGALESADSPEMGLTPMDMAPPAPSVVTVVEAGTHVKLAWSSSPEATLYSVKRSLTSGGPYQILADVTTTGFTDTAVTPGTTYYYVISATGPGGESANSFQAVAQPSFISPLARFQMDEGQGTVVEDGSGNGWNGSLINGPGRVAGKLDGAISLDGVNDHALLPDGVVGAVGDCTISAWVKTSGVGTWSRLFDFGTGTDNYLFLSLKAGSGKPRFAIRTSATSEEIIESGVAFPLNVWTHVAVSFAGNTGTLYLNGEAVGANSAMTLKPSSLGITTKNYLGRSQFADPYFAGQIDEFQITDRAMTAGEIADSATPPTAPANLVATSSAYTMNLTWNPVQMATAYTIKRASVGGGPYITIASKVAGTSYADAGLTPGTTYYYVVTAWKTVAESAKSLQVSGIPLDSEQAWRKRYFGHVSNAGSAADQADPDKDGTINLLERAFGGNPHVVESGLQPMISPGSPNVSLLYRKTVAENDLIYMIKESVDLTSWTIASGTEMILTDDGTTQLIRFTRPAGNGHRLFLRLEVVNP